MTRNIASSRIYLFTKMHIHLYIRLLRSAAACLALSASALRRRRKQQLQQQQQQQHKSDDVDLHVLLRRKEVIELAPWVRVVAELGYDVALVICDVDPPAGLSNEAITLSFVSSHILVHPSIHPSPTPQIPPHIYPALA